MQLYCPADNNQEYLGTKMSWHGPPTIRTDQPRISIINTFHKNEHAGF